MVVEIFALCDAATDYGGRMNLLGVFELLAAPRLPVVKDHCSVAARLRFDRTGAGLRQVAVRFVNAEGRQPVPDMIAPMQVTVADGRSTSAVNLVLNINGLLLPAFGLYEVQLLVDGRLSATLPLMVAQAKAGRSPRNPMAN